MIQFIKPGLRYASKIYNIRQIYYKNLKQDTSAIIEHTKTNMPVDIKNPFEKEKPLCILCKLKITPKYTNPRLLSQFVSRFTGKVYGRHITGLCRKQQDNLEFEIIKAVKCGLMPQYFRDPRFAHDPKLYDPDNPFRSHRY